MDTWQRSRVPPKLFYVSTVFSICSTVQQPCRTGAPVFRSSCTTFVDLKKKSWKRNVHGLHVPAFKLKKETGSFTKFCTKYHSDSNQTREGTRSGSAAKTKRCWRARAPNPTAQFWTCSVFQRIHISIVKEVQLKT